MTLETIRLMEKARNLSSDEWEAWKKQLLKEVDISNSEKQVYKILKELGIPTNVLGYQYIKKAIFLCIDNARMRKGITKSLYPAIAREYGTTWTGVEGAIRHAIETASESGNAELFTEVFGNAYPFKKGKPTNFKFIKGVTEYILNS